MPGSTWAQELVPSYPSLKISGLHGSTLFSLLHRGNSGFQKRERFAPTWTIIQGSCNQWMLLREGQDPSLSLFFFFQIHEVSQSTFSVTYYLWASHYVLHHLLVITPSLLMIFPLFFFLLCIPFPMSPFLSISSRYPY